MNGEVKNLVPTAPFNLTDVDRKLLSQTDEEYIPHSWEELKEIVGEYIDPPSIMAKMSDISKLPTIFQYFDVCHLSWLGTFNGPAKSKQNTVLSRITSAKSVYTGFRSQKAR